MCRAVPGRIVARYERDGTPMAHVDFDGLGKEACLAYVPDAEVGTWVIVHLGFAIEQLDEPAALEILAMFAELGELESEFGDGSGAAARANGERSA